MSVKPGDKVITDKYSGSNVKIGDDEFTIVRQGNILASPIFTLEPEYLSVITLSPGFTDMTTSLPSTVPPGPTAITSAA